MTHWVWVPARRPATGGGWSVGVAVCVLCVGGVQAWLECGGVGVWLECVWGGAWLE